VTNRRANVRRVRPDWSVIDETGFPQKGRPSVGVARQDSGTLGKIDHGQVGVFLGYASQLGHTWLDREL